VLSVTQPSRHRPWIFSADSVDPLHSCPHLIDVARGGAEAEIDGIYVWPSYSGRRNANLPVSRGLAWFSRPLMKCGFLHPF